MNRFVFNLRQLFYSPARALVVTAVLLSPAMLNAKLLDEYPALQQYTFKEPPSKVLVGFGLTPFEIVKSSPGFTAHLLQVHYLDRWIDWEMIGFSWAMTLSADTKSNKKRFIFRTVPKFRINSTFSIGMIGGYEFISFPEIDVVLTKNIEGNQFRTKPDAFSSRGWIYGFTLVENFPFRKYIMRASQMAYVQNYPRSKTAEDWDYFVLDEDLRAEQTSTDFLAPGWVLGLEFSFLY